MKNLTLYTRRVILSIACFAILGLFLAAPAVAQDKKETMPEKSYISVMTITVKAESAPQFEELMKTEYRDAFIKGGGKEMYVWHMSTGNPLEYVFVRPMEKLSAMGEQGPARKGFGEKMPEFYGKLSKMVDTVRVEMLEMMPQMSYLRSMSPMPKVAVVSYVQIDGEKAPMVDKFLMEEYLPVVSRSGVRGFHLHKMVFGGKSNTYVAVSFEDEYSAIDKGPPHLRVMKPEEAQKMFAKFPSGGIKAAETNVIHFHPEMSVVPGETAKN